MAYLLQERIIAQDAIQDVSALNIPNNATHAELQARVQNVAYTMDGSDPNQTTTGMVFLTTEPPKLFLIEDVQNIRFKRSTGTNGNLNIHYIGGRNV